MGKIILGDAMEELSKMPDNSVDLLLTDPPYDFDENMKQRLHSEFLRICSGDILVFSPSENQWVFPGVKYLFWVKPTSTKNYSKSYGRFVEMIFLYQRNKIWNRNLNWANYVGIYDDKVIGESGHPFEKPESLLKRFILIHTNQGNIVLDPFCGSGTVLKVAKDLGRNYIGIEKDEQYYQIACNLVNYV